jgi:hypothetical protein
LALFEEADTWIDTAHDIFDRFNRRNWLEWAGERLMPCLTNLVHEEEATAQEEAAKCQEEMTRLLNKAREHVQDEAITKIREKYVWIDEALLTKCINIGLPDEEYESQSAINKSKEQEEVERAQVRDWESDVGDGEEKTKEKTGTNKEVIEVVEIIEDDDLVVLEPLHTSLTVILESAPSLKIAMPEPSAVGKWRRKRKAVILDDIEEEEGETEKGERADKGVVEAEYDLRYVSRIFYIFTTSYIFSFIS